MDFTIQPLCLYCGIEPAPNYVKQLRYNLNKGVRFYQVHKERIIHLAPTQPRNDGSIQQQHTTLVSSNTTSISQATWIKTSKQGHTKVPATQIKVQEKPTNQLHLTE
jgi:hypothetical protein